MAQRLCNSVLGRSGEDDRDHYGKKRMDMVGVLMGDLFRVKFAEFKKKITANLVEVINKKNADKQINLTSIFNTGARTITDGLRYYFLFLTFFVINTIFYYFYFFFLLL